MRTYIILLLCLSAQAYAVDYNTKLEVLQSVVSKNQLYNKEIPPDTLIAWGEELEPILLREKKHKELFEVKYIIAQTHAMRGDISLAIDKAHTMSKEAQTLHCDLGLALASQAVGDTYTYSNMLKEAVTSYNQALEILKNNHNPVIVVFQKRLLIRLLQVCSLQNNADMEQVHSYLVQLKQILPKDKVNDPVYIYHLTFNALYNINMGLLDEAKEYLDRAKQYLSERNQQPLPSLWFTFALFHEKTGNNKAALANYKQLTPILVDGFNLIGQTNIIQHYTALLLKLGKAREACQLYMDVNSKKDSLSVKSYTRQMNRLYENYQVSSIELENQAQKTHLTRMGISVGIVVLFLSFLLAMYIRMGNKKLAESQKALEAAKRQAEASIRSKSMFLSNMSHEIRTPLNALSGFSAILTEESIDNETRLQCNEIIQQNSELLLKLINDVIDMSSLEFGSMQFNLKECDAIALCRNVVEMVQKIKQTNADIRFETTLDALTLHTDDARLQQVLINLLINATKFTPSGNINLSLSLQDERTALFSVSDTGCGITPENQKKIFRRFEKLDEQDQGTGLGLSISQLIIRHIGGKIWIDPEYTGGARFCFTHPIKKTGETVI